MNDEIAGLGERLHELTPHEALMKAEAERDTLLKLILDHVIESNDVGGIDANDLMNNVLREGFTFPDDE